MARTLDRTRSYAETWGNGMTHLEQDGFRFNVAGNLLPDEPGEWVEPAAETPAEVEPEAEPVPMSPGDKRRATWAAKRAKAESEAVADGPVPELADQSDDELKTLVDIAGGTWKDRDAAIAFLRDGAAH